MLEVFRRARPPRRPGARAEAAGRQSWAPPTCSSSPASRPTSTPTSAASAAAPAGRATSRSTPRRRPLVRGGAADRQARSSSSTTDPPHRRPVLRRAARCRRPAATTGSSSSARSDRLAGRRDPGRARELAEAACALVVDVSPAKRLADELEVLAAVRAITIVSADGVEATLAAVADRAAAALRCEYGAVHDRARRGSRRRARLVGPRLAPGRGGRRAPRAAAATPPPRTRCRCSARTPRARTTPCPRASAARTRASSIHVLPIGRAGRSRCCWSSTPSPACAASPRCASAWPGDERRRRGRPAPRARPGAPGRRERQARPSGCGPTWSPASRRAPRGRRRCAPRSCTGPAAALPASIVIVDLDDLKLVNDAEGHAAGDELLRRAGAALRASIRATDVVARIGGDEFGVLLRYTDESRGRSSGARAWWTRCPPARWAARRSRRRARSPRRSPRPTAACTRPRPPSARRADAAPRGAAPVASRRHDVLRHRRDRLHRAASRRGAARKREGDIHVLVREGSRGQARGADREAGAPTDRIKPVVGDLAEDQARRRREDGSRSTRARSTTSSTSPRSTT